MSYETEVYGALSGLVSGRVFPDVAPFGTAMPYMTWQKVGGYPIHYIGNDAVNKEHSLVQVNVWAASRIEANSLARQVEDALRLLSSSACRPESAAISIHEPGLNMYGTHQEFSIFSAR